MHIDAGFAQSVLCDLVRRNSINPYFSGGATNEVEAAGYFSDVLGGLGMSVTVHERTPGRPSVVGRLPGRGGGRSLLLYGHLDTVGVEGMSDPFEPSIADGRVHGRGAYDMKGGLAACAAAVRALIDADVGLAGDVIVVAAADEETESAGIREVLAHVTADAAIVTEATELEVCVAHKGFAWLEVETVGRAAHGSRFMDGIDANMHMGRVVCGLSALEQRLRASAGHPLLGPPTLHAPLIRGGVGISTYSPSCHLEVERRTIPGETEAQVLGEIQALLDRESAADPSFHGRVRCALHRPPFEARPDSPIVAEVVRAASLVRGTTPRVMGHGYWMDAALLAAAGIDTVVIGPSGRGAHAIEEYVELGSVTELAQILATAAIGYCGPGTPSRSPAGQGHGPAAVDTPR
jgi:acetylornithine deacetylase